MPPYRTIPSNEEPNLATSGEARYLITGDNDLLIAIPIVVRYRVLGFEESGVRS